MTFSLASTTIFVTVTGSHAYGTATPSSDWDVRGVCIMPLRLRLSHYYSFEQNDGDPHGLRVLCTLDHVERAKIVHAWCDAPSWDVTKLREWKDCTIYEIAKAVRLFAEGNPNMLELLYTPRDCVVHEMDEWKKLVEIRDVFLSQRVRHTFSGYAHAQLKKIVRHRSWLRDPPTAPPTRKEFGLPESSVLDADTRDAIEAEIRVRTGEDKGDVVVTDVERMSAALELGLPQTLVQALSAERAYRAKLKHWKAYLEWKKNRNPERAKLEEEFGYDCKHAQHLVRLVRMGVEALRDGVVMVRRPDADELRAIRYGAWPFEKLMEFADTIDDTMRTALAVTKLPHSPDHEKIDEVLYEIIAP